MLKQRPLNCIFNLGNIWKLVGAKSGKYGGCWSDIMLFSTRRAQWQSTLLSWRILADQVVFTECPPSNGWKGHSYTFDYELTLGDELLMHNSTFSRMTHLTGHLDWSLSSRDVFFAFKTTMLLRTMRAASCLVVVIFPKYAHSLRGRLPKFNAKLNIGLLLLSTTKSHTTAQRHIFLNLRSKYSNMTKHTVSARSLLALTMHVRLYCQLLGHAEELVWEPFDTISYIQVST